MAKHCFGFQSDVRNAGELPFTLHLHWKLGLAQRRHCLAVLYSGPPEFLKEATQSARAHLEISCFTLSVLWLIHRPSVIYHNWHLSLCFAARVELQHLLAGKQSVRKQQQQKQPTLNQRRLHTICSCCEFYNRLSIAVKMAVRMNHIMQICYYCPSKGSFQRYIWSSTHQ